MAAHRQSDVLLRQSMQSTERVARANWKCTSRLKGYTAIFNNAHFAFSKMRSISFANSRHVLQAAAAAAAAQRTIKQPQMSQPLHVLQCIKSCKQLQWAAVAPQMLFLELAPHDILTFSVCML
jgi:hypothetical protein